MPWYEIVIRVLLAVLVGCIIGAEREHQHRPAGLRTHILVCVGAALVAVLESLNAASFGETPGVSVSFGRMSAQVISGIGFLGAGTIFMASKKIAGLTTAASLWCTACLGLAAGMGHYILLGAGCLTVVLTLALLPHVVHHDHLHRVEVTLTDRTGGMTWLQAWFREKNIRVLDVDFSETDGACKAVYTLHLPRRMTLPQLVLPLADKAFITGVRTLNE